MKSKHKRKRNQRIKRQREKAKPSKEGTTNNFVLIDKFHSLKFFENLFFL
jgi:hypothetical protein